MKITFFDTNEYEQGVLRGFLEGVEVEKVFIDQALDKDNVNLASDAEVVSVFVGSKVDKEIIDLLPNLKYLITRSTGFDHVDIKYASEKGIKVSNVPGYGAHTVAEFAFGLILNLSRKICQVNRNLINGDGYETDEFQGFDLFGKTLGVVGTGRIGKNVVRIAKGFGMNVVASDVFPDEKFATELSFKYAPLEEVLKTADILTLHAPYTEANYHLINRANIFLMKKGSVLINTARGELVDTEALVEALSNDHLAGAGLDVLEGEHDLREEEELLKRKDQIKDYKTLFENHVLIEMPQVIVTPHVAFFSKEAEEEILKVTAENIECFLKNGPKNLVC